LPLQKQRKDGKKLRLCPSLQSFENQSFAENKSFAEGASGSLRGRQISCRLRIEQRMVDPITNQSYFDILNNIANFFQINLLIKKQIKTGKIYYHLTASSCKSLQIVLNYFNNYSLYSSKYLDYKDFAEAALLILEQKQYTNENTLKIINLKNSMNNSRVYFN
jgi:hypothetical protein